MTKINEKQTYSCDKASGEIVICSREELQERLLWSMAHFDVDYSDVTISVRHLKNGNTKIWVRRRYYYKDLVIMRLGEDKYPTEKAIKEFTFAWIDTITDWSAE